MTVSCGFLDEYLTIDSISKLLPIRESSATEIKRIQIQSQPGQIICKTLSQKSPSQKRAGRMAQGVGPEFKSQHHKKK
jgi:hypothetical protein